MARILFLQKFWFEFLGTMYLSAVLKADGHDCQLLIEGGEKDFLGSVEKLSPDLVCFYCTTGAHVWALDTAGRVKQRLPRTKVILGGPHPTYFPEIISHPAVDFICRGEGEIALLTLARCLDTGAAVAAIPNLWTKADGQVRNNPIGHLLQDLDALPLPDRAIYYSRYPMLKNSPNKHFITGRGCPYSCSFCCNKAYNELYRGKGTLVRRLSPRRVIEDITQVASAYPLEAVRFDDEVFLLRPSWLREFLDLYRQHVTIPFTCLIRVDLITPDISHLLSLAGCYAAYFGIESGDDELRNRVLGKRITREEILNAAALLRRNGISVGSFNMVGIPGESIEQAFATVKLNQQARVDLPWCSIVQPYPATELLDFAVREGYVEPEDGVAHFCQSYFNRSIVANKDRDLLVNLHKFFYLAVKVPWLEPVIRQLIKVPPNRIYDGLFSLTFACRYTKTYRVPFMRLLRTALLMKDNY